MQMMEQGRQIFLSIGKCDIGRIEMDAMGRILFQELPDSASQNSADKDIRIQNDHRGYVRLAGRRICLNSATISSSLRSASAVASRSAAALSSEISAVLVLRRVGT